MERLNLAILNQATTSGACPPSHHAHPPAAAGSFIHPEVVGHERHLAAIESALATPHDRLTVVVTHHAPSAKSVEVPITAADAASASDLGETVLRHRPKLWVHGHNRRHSDYVFGEPRGHQGDEWGKKSGSIGDFVVDVQ